MSKKNNKHKKFDRVNDETDEETIKVSAKHKEHGYQRKEYLRAKQLRQDIENFAAFSEARHAA